MKQILILGDSFCRERELQTDWPVALANKLNVRLEGCGFGGQGFWSQRRWLMENLEKFGKDTVLVICHSDWSRLPCNKNWPITTWVLDESQTINGNTLPENSELRGVDPSGKLTKVAQDFYQSELYVDDFYKWALQSWFAELNTMHSKFYQVIHLTGFKLVKELLLQHQMLGVTVTTSLGSIALCEDNGKFRMGPDTRRNHMSEHNNQQLAEFLFSLITNSQPKETTCITNLSKFKFETKRFLSSSDLRENGM